MLNACLASMRLAALSTFTATRCPSTPVSEPKWTVCPAPEGHQDKVRRGHTRQAPNACLETSRMFTVRHHSDAATSAPGGRDQEGCPPRGTRAPAPGLPTDLIRPHCGQDVSAPPPATS